MRPLFLDGTYLYHCADEALDAVIDALARQYPVVSVDEESRHAIYIETR